MNRRAGVPDRGGARVVGRVAARGLVCALLSGCAPGQAPAASSSGPSRSDRPAAVASRAGTSGAGTSTGGPVSGRPGSTTAPATPATVARDPAVPPDALAVLHAWDARRARAYARGSVAALRRLYVVGARAGSADVRLLRDYLARGYHVQGMRMQVLSVRVLRRGPGRWRLRVTDRLAAATAVGPGGSVALPRDRASTRTLTLVRGADGGWRVAAVREGALSAAPRPAGRAGSGPRR